MLNRIPSAKGMRASAVLPILIAGLAYIGAAMAPVSAGVFNPKSFVLDNGLKVIVIENTRAPIVIQMVWYRVGSADEPHGKSGIAHFLEHLMFKGTPSIPAGEFSKIVARNGGQDNAFTSLDYTAYFQRVAKDKLELVMRMEADRMANLTLDEKDVAPEREVVLEERKSRTGNNPAAQLYEQTMAAKWLTHPYRKPVIGWQHEIEKLSRQDALDFYKVHYAPNNAALIVAGDVTVEQVRVLAERYYGPIPSKVVPERKREADPPALASRRVELKSPRVRQPDWYRSYRAPSYNVGAIEHAYALQVLSRILSDGTTGRFYRRLVVDQKIAVAAGAWYDADKVDLGSFGLSITPRAGIDISKAEAAMETEVARLLADGVSDEEVARAKKAMQAAAIYVRDGLRAGPNIFGRAFATGRSIEDVEQWPERISAVTREQVNAAIKAVFDGKTHITSVLLPDPAS